MTQKMPAQGRLTFEAEGNDDATSPYYTRRLHWPAGASGVTIGRGYDMKTKSEAKVKADLVAAGLPDDLAGKYAKGAKLEGAAAKKFAADHKSVYTELTWDQQLSLFEATYEETFADAKWRATATKAAGGCKEYGVVDWDKLDARIRDVVVDLRYRGDYKTSTYAQVQEHVVANDYAEFRKALRDADFWKTQKGVPKDRYDRRVGYLPDEGGDDEEDEGDHDWNEIVDESRRYESPCKSARPKANAKPTHIVIHITGTDKFQSVHNRFMTPKEASAHYLVDREGHLHQFVRDGESAWHAGILKNVAALYAKNDGTWRKYKRYLAGMKYPAGSKYLDAAMAEVTDPSPEAQKTIKTVVPAAGGNWSDYDYFEKRWGTANQPFHFGQDIHPNNYSIGIELLSYGSKEAGPKHYPEALYAGLDRLLANLCKKYGIPRDRQHIVGHEDVDPCSRWGWDPDQGFDWDRVLKKGEAPAEAEPEIDHGNPTAFELASMSEDQRYDHLKDTWKRAQKRFEHEGDSVYDFQEANGRVNLLSARGLLMSTLEPVANTRAAWDDTLFVIFKDKDGHKKVKTFVISTEPNDPDALDHCSTLKVGMHKYVIGTHHKSKPYSSLKDHQGAYPGGGYRALNPQGGGVVTYLDHNHNLTEDPGDKSINDAAINVHFGGNGGISTWSWGCQVVKGWPNYIALLRLIEADVSIKGSIKNELADKPASDGTRPVIYLLLEGTFLRPAAAGYPLGGYPLASGSAEALYALNEKGEGGFFPIGANNFWHGGVHLDTESPVVAVADGEVVAYRISREPIQAELGGVTMPISTSFVLVHHLRKTPKEQEIDFFSLYMHLLPLGAYTEEQKKGAPSQLKKRTFVVRVAEDGKGLNVRSGADREAVVGVIPKDVHFEVTPDDFAAWNGSYQKVSYEGIEGYALLQKRAVKVSGNTYQCLTSEDTPKDTSKRGLNVRETGSGSRVVRIAPKGEELKFKLPHMVAPGGKLVAGWFELEDGGWVYVRAGTAPTIEFSFVFEPEALDKVVNLDPALPITAGAIVGYPGPYLVRPKTVHFEIITGDVGFMKNPKGDEGGRSLLEIPAGTTFKKRTKPAPGATKQVNLPAGSRLAIVDRHGTYRKVVAHEIAGWAATTALGDYDAATRSFVLKAPLANLYKKAPDQGPVSIQAPKGARLALLDQSGASRKVRYALPESTYAKNTGWAPVAELGKWDDKEDYFELAKPITKLYDAAPSETYEFKEDAGQSEATLYPDAPDAGSPAICWDAAGHAWYEIEYAPGAKGWFDPDQPGVKKQCIYDWPRWQQVEEQGEFSDDGLCDASSIVGLIDADGNGDVTSTELKQALANPTIAAKLRRIACLHPTEWAGKLEGLDRLGGAPWYVPKKDRDATKEYIQKLGFWDDVKKAKLPPKDKVWNLHPIGFLEHLQGLSRAASAACDHPKLTIWQHFKEDPLTQSNTHLVQLVAEASFKHEVALGGADEAAKKTRTNYGMLQHWKRVGWQEFLNANRKNEERSKSKPKVAAPKEADTSYDLGFTTAKGEVDLHAELLSSLGCSAKTHTLTLLDPKNKATTLDPAGAKLTVAYEGEDTVPSKVVPARYHLQGAVCGGTNAVTTIEVYPASSLLWEFKVEQEMEPWDKLANGFKKLVKVVGGEFTLEASGSIAGFFGWRADGFRVYYAYEIVGKGGIKLGYEQKISFLQFFTGGVPIPASITKYVGDIGISFEIKGGVSLELKVELREFPPGATDLGWQPNLALTLKLSIDVAVGLYAELHAVVFSVEATGKVKCGVSGGGKLAWKNKKVTLAPFATLEEGDIVVTITLKSMMTKHEKEWVFPLWPAKDLLKDESGGDKYQWVIYDYSQKKKQPTTPAKP